MKFEGKDQREEEEKVRVSVLLAPSYKNFVHHVSEPLQEVDSINAENTFQCLMVVCLEKFCWGFPKWRYAAFFKEYCICCFQICGHQRWGQPQTERAAWGDLADLSHILPEWKSIKGRKLQRPLFLFSSHLLFLRQFFHTSLRLEVEHRKFCNIMKIKLVGLKCHLSCFLAWVGPRP